MMVVDDAIADVQFFLTIPHFGGAVVVLER
jgi:hypothetical protein